MSEANVAAARRMYEARNSGNVEAVLAVCDPEVEWRPYLADLGGKPIRGHAEVREYLASLDEHWEHFRHDPVEFVEVGEKVVAMLDTHARGRSSGVDLLMEVGHVLSFRDGKVLGYISYPDREQALRAAGAST